VTVATHSREERKRNVRARILQQVRQLAPARIREALEAFQGEIEQIPPQYSAKKVGGESMHRRARRGETVALKPSTVRVRELEVLEIEPPRVRFRVECSSGTYIRALARDLGMALGVGGHLVELRRTRIGSFRADCALSVDDLDDARKVADASIPTLSALGHLPSWTAGADEVSDLVEGRGVRVTEVVTGPGREGPVVAAAGGRVLAIGAVSEGCFRPSKVFR